MLAVRVPDEEIGRTLQERQEREEEKEEPVSETAESKVQRYPPVENPARALDAKVRLKIQSEEQLASSRLAARSTCCAKRSGRP